MRCNAIAYIIYHIVSKIHAKTTTFQASFKGPRDKNKGCVVSAYDTALYFMLLIKSVCNFCKGETKSESRRALKDGGKLLEQLVEKRRGILERGVGGQQLFEDGQCFGR